MTKELIDIPSLSLCALKISNTTRNRIIAAGGSIITFDQLAIQNPIGKNTVLLR